MVAGAGSIAPDTSPVRLAESISGRISPGDGQADGVLWLHGYTLDSSSWDELWAMLPGWRHLAVDFPAHGASDAIAPGTNLHTLARRLADICVAQQVSHVVALSFGTITGLQLVIDHPGLLRSIVLGAPSIAGGPQDAGMAEAYAGLFRTFHARGPGPHMVEQWMGCHAWDGVDERPGLRERLHALVSRHRWSELRDYAIRAFTEPAQDETDMGAIGTPMLVLVGDREMPAYRECADLLQQQVPGCEQAELPDTCHLCMLQSPELSAELIGRHLRRHARHAPAGG